MIAVNCVQCDETMQLSVKSRERWTPLAKNERATAVPFSFDEWVCPNGHRRDLTHAESRMFE